MENILELLKYLQVLWIPDVIIHDLVMFSKPEILNEVAALEIFKNGKVYYKIRQVLIMNRVERGDQKGYERDV